MSAAVKIGETSGKMVSKISAPKYRSEEFQKKNFKS